MRHRSVIKSLWSSIVSLMAIVLGASIVDAQTSTGNIRGRVTGEVGAPVSDVQVVARNLDNNQERGALTTANGTYFIGGLRPGKYEVSVRRIGFAPQSRPVQVQ